jgi:hypothetical protein
MKLIQVNFSFIHSYVKCLDHLKQSKGYTTQTQINRLMTDRVSQVSVMQKNVLFSTVADISGVYVRQYFLLNLTFFVGDKSLLE